MRLFKQLSIVLGAVLVLFGILMIFTYDIIKIDWPVFMEIQPSYRPMEDPLLPPERSIPVEGAVSIPNMGAPENPVPADDASIARGAQLYALHCLMCHGTTGEGNGSIAAFLVNFKPANLTLDVVQNKSDGALFLTVTNGVTDRMPALNENLDVRERWDVINYIRTLKAMQP
jgi:S-disulfanyl-L-cysteine oxidoreductase SoxD